MIGGHVEHLKKVLEKLRQYKLCAKTSKCLIVVQEIEFFGQLITPKRMCLVDAKLHSVGEWDRSSL